MTLVASGMLPASHSGDVTVLALGAPPPLMGQESLRCSDHLGPIQAKVVRPSTEVQRDRALMGLAQDHACRASGGGTGTSNVAEHHTAKEDPRGQTLLPPRLRTMPRYVLVIHDADVIPRRVVSLTSRISAIYPVILHRPQVV